MTSLLSLVHGCWKRDTPPAATAARAASLSQTAVPRRERVQALVLSDDDAVSVPVREVLLRAGYLCQFPEIVRLADARQRVASVQPGIVVVVLAPDPERALATVAALRKEVRGRIVAVGPTNDPKLILETLERGAEHYLDEGQAEVELKRLLERLASLGAIREAEPGRIICLTTPTGGTGSSTLAANLAVLFARQARSCALFDLQLETDDLSGLLDLKPTNTWIDLVRHVDQLDQIGFERALTRHDCGVSLLASPTNPNERNLVTSKVVRLSLSWARALFPVVVVDVGLLLDEGKTEALRLADSVVVVFHLNFSSLRNVRRQLDQLGNLGVPRSRVCLVANRCGQPNELSTAEAADCLGLPIFACVADDPKAVNQANNTGKPVALDGGRGRFFRDLTALAARLCPTAP